MYSLIFIGKMSVRKLWVAGDPLNAIEYTADVTQNAVEPVGSVRNEIDGSVVEPSSLNEASVNAIRIASMCNVAT